MSGKYHQKTVDPGESAVMKQMEIKTEVGRAEPKDLNVCCACCCDISSLFCKFPDVFGSECFWTCFCSKCGMQNCKPSVDKGDVFSGEVRAFIPVLDPYDFNTGFTHTHTYIYKHYVHTHTLTRIHLFQKRSVSSATASGWLSCPARASR